MKQLFGAILLLISLGSNAQDFEDSWTGHFSYTSVKDISQGDNKIYAASENSIFTYDLTTLEISTLSSVNGLSGEAITTIHYSEAHELLIIGYETGLMDIVIDGDENVLKVVDILEKQTIPPDQKRINHFNEYEGKIFISTQYGISVYDLAALEFGDTYFIGDIGSQIDITQTTIKEPYIYASTRNFGIKRAIVANDNLIDYEQWETVVGGNFLGIQNLQNQLFALNTNNTVLREVPSGFSPIENFSTTIVDFQSHNDLLTITTSGAIRAYAEDYTLVASVTSLSDFDLNLQSGYSFNNHFYIGTKEDGLLEVPFSTNTALQILPDGPLRNDPFAIDASPGQLWVNYGAVSVTFNPFPLTRFGISNLKENTWTNIPYEELSNAVGDVTDLVNVSINPENSNEVYMTSFIKGLLKIENQIPTILYDQSNSPLEIIDNNPDVGIRLFGSEFDREGNLWFVQSKTNEGLIKFTPGGQFQKIDLSEIFEAEDELALTVVAISRENYVFIGSSGSGLIGYKPQTGALNKISTNVGNGNLPWPDVRALAFDNQNRLWIGTLRGLRVLFSPGSFFEEGADTDSQPIIILENDIAQELLFEQSITDIEVDGSNNKWIATANSGVFYLSANGQETLLRFDKDNSPLPSNNVQDIAIDPFTGVVYFATVNGLLAYDGTATAPRDNLEKVYAFPNPVRPGFSGNVTIDGLTAQANVKITDIEGNLVFEETSQGGSILWDTSAFGRYKVRSGVYLVLITTEDATETKVSKIMIIR